MKNLKKEFDEIRELTPQERGKKFEKFLGTIFSNEGIRCNLAYRPTGEEIDGAIWWINRTFLLEAKWINNPVPASTIYAFKGKVDGKLDQTLGLFISMSGYSEDCVDALTYGKNLNILLFDSSDLESIIEGEKFARILEDKLFAAGQTGNVYLPWPELNETQAVITSVVKEQERVESEPHRQRPLLVTICEGGTDRLILESMVAHVERNTGRTFAKEFVVAGGKHPLLKAMAPAVASIIAKGISGEAAILLVFDADTNERTVAEHQKQKAEKFRDELPASWKTHVAVAIPTIEAWLGSHERVPRNEIQELLESISWGDVEKTNAEVASLLAFLREVT